MKAARLLEYGGQKYCVNHLDLVEASGSLKQILPIDLPWIPGHEFSGVVEQIDREVAAWAEGDAVFGTTTRSETNYNTRVGGETEDEFFRHVWLLR